MTWKRFCDLVNLATYEHKDGEIMKVKLGEMKEAIDDCKDTIARLEAELKCTKIANSSLMSQLHKAVMDKGFYLEELA